MPYVDGFVLAVPKANIEAYKEMARLGGEVWMDHVGKALLARPDVADHVHHRRRCRDGNCVSHGLASLV